MVDINQINKYILEESIRQSATTSEVGGMFLAWEWLSARDGCSITTDTIKRVSELITGNGEYRIGPAVFDNGASAVPAALIGRSMNGFVDAVNNGLYADEDVDLFVKEFLDIHPFSDGNGRVASLLRNWLLETMDSPTPLPYYYGEMG